MKYCFFLLLWSSTLVAKQSTILTLDFDWFDAKRYSLHAVIPPHLYYSRPYVDFFTELTRRTQGRIPGVWTQTRLFPFLEKWIPNHYHDIGLYPEIPNARLEKILKKTNALSKQRSAILFITPANEPENILALVRWDHQTEEWEVLGIEEFLMEIGEMDTLFERPEPKYNAEYLETEYFFVLINGKFVFAQRHRSKVRRARGTLAEVMNFNLVDPSLAFMPLLYLAGEALGMSQWGGKR